MRKFAFTLAEVLITLTILGVVAAITVPSLMEMNYKRVSISRMAKGYATLENAAANIAQNTNCVGKGMECTGLLDLKDDELRNKFVELSGIRVNKEQKGTTIKVAPLNYKMFSNKSHTAGETLGTLSVYYIMPDNIAFSIDNPVSFSSDGKKGIRIHIITDKFKLYDINGKKIVSNNGRSNAIYGRDIFEFTMWGNFQVEPLTNTWNFEPMSRRPNANFASRCNPNSTVEELSYLQGVDCAARIIKDGWKMKY